MSHTQLRRIEIGALERPTVDHLGLGCAAAGLRLLVRAVPGDDPALDAGQLAVLKRLRAQVASSIPIRTEVALPVPTDRRAWDAVLGRAPDVVAVEAEARIRDIQAVERRCALKQRDGGIERVILLVADTRSNRDVLRLHREALRERFPLDSRALLADLRAGRLPPRSGILLI